MNHDAWLADHIRRYYPRAVRARKRRRPAKPRPKPSATRLTLALPFVLVAMALAVVGCTPSALQVQAATADAVARATNAAAPLLVAAYERDCNAAVEHAPAGEGKAALEACRARWRPAWTALELEVAALDAWTAQLVAGGVPDWAALLRAACAVPRAVAELAPAVPLGVVASVCAAGGG